MKKYIYILTLFLLTAPTTVLAQGSPLYGKGLKLDIDAEGKSYIRFITWLQVWTRYTELNPGSTVAGEAQDQAVDIGVRRARFMAYAQITDDFLILSHFGINNQSFVSDRKPGLFFHDAWAEYKAIDRHLYLGFGLHYWNGVSRLNSASTLNFLGIDSPIFTWMTIDGSDQFARNMGIYAKGKLGKLDYRVALNHPFAVKNDVTGEAAVYNPTADTWATTGYVMYQAFDEEPNKLPFTVGSWLGSKKVLNFGTGWLYRPRAMATLGSEGQLVNHDMWAVGLDIFADIPVGDNGAFTGYAHYAYYGFGPDNLRSVGLMNVGAGGTSLAGGGNAYPMIGTGHHFFVEAGYLLPKTMVGLDLQPYVMAHVAQMEALEDPSMIFDVGVNWLLMGHHSKFTLNYKNRPIFARDTRTAEARASEVILQSMIYF